MENIDHLFKNCDFAYNVWTTINFNCSSPIATDHDFMELIEHIWDDKNSYHKLLDHPLGEYFTILWTIWTYRNEFVFKGHKCIPITVLAHHMFS